MNYPKKNWKLLNVLMNETRVDIVEILLKTDRLCMTEVAKELEKKGWSMRFPAVVKHVGRLEEVGILRSESGSLADEPDARKTYYILEGKERVLEVMNHLGKAAALLESGATFGETAKIAARVQGSEQHLERLKSLVARCDSEEVKAHLTEDERRRLKLWKVMLTQYP